MEIRKYRVFQLADSLVYLLPLALLLGLFVLLLAKGAPGPFIGILGISTAAWGFVCSRLFWPRYKTKKSIKFYVKGWAVIPDGAPVDEARFNTIIDEVLEFWEKKLGKPMQSVGLDGVIAIYTTTTGIRDVRFPELGPAHGLTSGNHTRLAYNPEDPETMYRVLGHEIGHSCLDFVGFQGDHHAFMHESGDQYS